MYRIVFLYLIILIFPAYSQVLPIQKSAAGSVKIGLLISDKKYVAAKNGAELAISQANEKGGYNGLPFELVVRSMEGPWGTGAKEAVSLIFTDKVSAVLGSTDGRNAHLVEQVTTKSRMVFLSAWSGDPTLTQAFVPWFFSCVPNNNQQAEALVNEIYLKQNLNPVGIVSEPDYDSQSALKSFLKQLKIAGKNDPVQFSTQDLELSGLTDQIVKANLKCLVLFVKPLTGWKLVAELATDKNTLPIYCCNSIMNEDELPVAIMSSIYEQPGVVTSQWLNPKKLSFQKEFQKKFGIIPGAVASFSFDGMNLLIEAIKKGGPERENIQKALAETKSEGVTGSVSFDEKGNRTGTLITAKVINGTPGLTQK